MKILIVSPRFTPEPFSIGKIAEQLVKDGNDVTVLTDRPNYGKWKFYEGYEKYIKREIINGVNVIRAKTKARKQNKLSLFIEYVDSHFKYKKELKKLKCDFDVVLAHGLSPLFCLDYVGKYCKKNRIPSLFYGLDLWPESFVASSTFKRNSIAYKIMKRYSIKLYNKFDTISYASPSAGDYLKNELRINKPFVHVYQPCLTKVPDRSIIENHQYFKDGKLHILYCGTLAKFIHLDLMIDAINQFKDKEKIVFDVVGSGSDENNLKDLVKKYNLESYVIMHGRVSIDDTINYYKKADVLFIPLYWNSATSNMIPQKVIECFMYSRPILGMLKGDGANLINNASSFNIVCKQDIKSLENSFNKLLNYSTKVLEAIGNDNRNFYAKNPRFLLSTVSNELEEIMINLIKTSK